MKDMLQENMDEYLPLRDVVFKTLRQGILTGELKPGERLMEIHLANRLGVSRTPIREAIRKLELEGLVIMIPRRGAEVAQITEKNLQDVLEVRRELDAFAARLACQRMNEEQMGELKEAAEAFERAVETKDATIIAKADVAFHDIILKSTENDRLIQLVNNLAEQVYRYRFEYVKDKTSHNRLIQEHRNICESIVSRDEKAAAAAVGVHVDNQEKSIREQLHFMK
ncbi:MAG: GntR family transcriptional regulator [Roseburia sp.]|nr:GntR family transcriptional regulator [Roseburia sp.]MCM1279505.1 GntR family transcriptional regulator [Robinsoniella sp.]